MTTREFADLLARARITVTCLLYNEGGWWSPSCIVSTAIPPCMARQLTSVLVGIVLSELLQSGEVTTGFVGRPGCEPLFRYAASPANAR